METSDPQTPQSVHLATAGMILLWRAATGALLHGPRCTCVGFGMMHRSSAELERDIAEFLIAKYEDRRREGIVRLFQRWIDECAPGALHSDSAPAGSVQNEDLLPWIDRNASSMNVSTDDLGEIDADIRALLESMAVPAAEFVCI